MTHNADVQGPGEQKPAVSPPPGAKPSWWPHPGATNTGTRLERARSAAECWIDHMGRATIAELLASGTGLPELLVDFTRAEVMLLRRAE